MKLQVLHPDVVRELLKGRDSCIGQLAEQDARTRADISAQVCPHKGCGEALFPRQAGDAAHVFGPAGIRYERHCPRHGLIT